MKDKAYLSGLLNNDDKVLRAIYKNFYERIRTFIIKNNGTSDDAKDVFQDALMVIYQKSQSPDFELSSSFYTYLYSICKLTWYAKRRKKSHQTVTILDETTLMDSDDIEQDLLNREMDKIYRDNFVQLNAFCQQLFRLVFLGKKMEEIAETLILKNKHTARNRKYRCSQELIQLMKKDERYREFKDLD